jgi:hypothetical protein
MKRKWQNRTYGKGNGKGNGKGADTDSDDEYLEKMGFNIMQLKNDDPLLNVLNQCRQSVTGSINYPPVQDFVIFSAQGWQWSCPLLAFKGHARWMGR